MLHRDEHICQNCKGKSKDPILEVHHLQSRQTETTWKFSQNRRNNRGLQTNRKGFRPSIRKQKYMYQPGDLVKQGKKIYTVKGLFNYGTWARVINKYNNVRNVPISKLELLKYKRGIVFEL